VSTPNPTLLARMASPETLMLSPDSHINQSLIEYEDWLKDAISALKGPLRVSGGPQLQVLNDLIEEITLVIKEVQAAKSNEWSRQLDGMQIEAPLPSFVINNKCAIVDGG
jgi:hypothetical protein